jgi:hypothetical protein
MTLTVENLYEKEIGETPAYSPPGQTRNMEWRMTLEPGSKKVREFLIGDNTQRTQLKYGFNFKNLRINPITD